MNKITDSKTSMLYRVPIWVYCWVRFPI